MKLKDSQIRGAPHSESMGVGENSYLLGSMFYTEQKCEVRTPTLHS